MIEPEPQEEPILEELFNEGGVTEDGIAFDGVKGANKESPDEE